MPHAPRFRISGDRVLVAEYGDRIDETVNALVHRVAGALRRAAPPGLIEVVPTYRSLAAHVDPLRLDWQALRDLIERLGDRAGDVEAPPPRTVEVPVAYGGAFGPDLADVARHAGMTEAEVIGLHAGTPYRVFMMGFTPGFPYLGGMSPRIAVPRLATPRTHVPAGSVGIAAQQTGIYPTASPGGWRLVGRTPLRLFDPAQDPPSLLDAGDQVRFVPIDASRYADLEGEAASLDGELHPEGDEVIDVLDSGMLTTVQDCGRTGYQRFGVPVAGAMDVFALRVANALVGNSPEAAGLEMTLAGPTLRFLRDATIAVTGGDLEPRLNGRPAPMWRSIDVRAGATWSCEGRRTGMRAYLAVRGGLGVPLVLGSRSTYLASGFGGVRGRALREGDRLTVDPRGAVGPAGPRRLRNPPGARAADAVTVRVVLGPQDDAFTAKGLETFLSAPYTMSAKSDRVGCRFEGPAIAHASGADIVSDGTSFGSVQVAGDGLPIVLMADRGTTGGYTKVATVVSADLGVLAQAAPGERFVFRAVSLDDAVSAARAADAVVAASAALSQAGAGLSGVFDEDSGAEWIADAIGDFASALGGAAAPDAAPGPGVRAGLTGLVVEVLVAAGQAVSERQPLAVIEAMKMLNPIRASRSGVVARVCVTPGELVTANTTVVEFDV